jgi:hypothetical protein
MPWEANSMMEERLPFIGRLLDGESLSDVCRKTGHKIYSLHREHGLLALTERSRRWCAMSTHKRYWGGRKIRELLVSRLRRRVAVGRYRHACHANCCRRAITRRPARPGGSRRRDRANARGV